MLVAQHRFCRLGVTSGATVARQLCVLWRSLAMRGPSSRPARAFASKAHSRGGRASVPWAPSEEEADGALPQGSRQAGCSVIMRQATACPAARRDGRHLDVENCRQQMPALPTDVVDPLDGGTRRVGRGAGLARGPENLLPVPVMITTRPLRSNRSFVSAMAPLVLPLPRG